MPETLLNNRQSIFNEYFSLLLDSDHILLSTRHGGWSILTKEEYGVVRSNALYRNSQLFENLEDAGIILTEKSREKIFRDLEQENSFLFHPTDYHVVAITNKCNANCVYCHPGAGPGGEEMNELTAQKIINFIFSVPLAGRLKILIEGGEPLLKWDLVKFIYRESVYKAREKGLNLQFSFTTNLSLMTNEIAKELVEMGITPCASFDGPKELHNQHRPMLGGGESYDKTVYWIQRLKKDYGLKIYVLPVITNLSLKYGPEAIIDEYLKLGQEDIFLKPFRANGRALASFDKLGMRPEDFFDFWKRGIEYCIALNKRGIRIKELNTLYFIDNILSSRRQSMCHRGPCGAGLSILSYAPDGTINGCDSARGEKFFDLGHVDRDDYRSIRTKAISFLKLSPDLIPDCSTCSFVAYCGHCLADIFGRERGLCSESPKAFQCNWQKMAFTYLFRKLSENKEDAVILRTWR